jgi:hypothetical protein
MGDRGRVRSSGVLALVLAAAAGQHEDRKQNIEELDGEEQPP